MASDSPFLFELRYLLECLQDLRFRISPEDASHCAGDRRRAIPETRYSVAGTSIR